MLRYKKLYRLLLLCIIALAAPIQGMQAAPVRQSNELISMISDCDQARSLYSAGQWSEALKLLESIYVRRDVAIEAQPRNDAGMNSIGDCLVFLGNIQLQIVHWDGAQESYRAAGSLFRRTDNIMQLLSTLERSLLISLHRGRYDDVIVGNQEVLVIISDARERDKFPYVWVEIVYEVTAYSNLGQAYHIQGRNNDALEAFEAALETFRRSLDQTDMTQLQENIREEMRQYYLAMAEQTGKELDAEAIDQIIEFTSTLPESLNTLLEAQLLNSISMVYASMGKSDQWEFYTQETSEKIHQSTQESIDNISSITTDEFDIEKYITSLYTLENSWLMSIENFEPLFEQGGSEELIADMQQVREQMQRMGELDPVIDAQILSLIGFIYFVEGENTNALSYLEEAVDSLNRIGPSDKQGVLLASIGIIYSKQGRDELAIEKFEASMPLLEATRALAGSEASRISFFAQFATVYENAVEIYVRQGNPEYDEKAFFTSERGRARTFLDSLATGQVQLEDNPHAELFQRERELAIEQQQIDSALVNARMQEPPQTDQIRLLEASQERIAREYQHIRNQIDSRADQLNQLIPGRSRVLGVSEVQAGLDNQTTLVSFYMLSEKTLVFLISASDFEIVELPISRAELIEEVKNFHTAFRGDITEAYPQAAETLYAALIQPIAPKISPNTRHLVIVPHGVLHYLPFAALTDGTRYLIDIYTLTTLPSASVLEYIKPTSIPVRPNILLLGNPTTEEDPLPQAEDEVESIASLYDQSALIGSAATESAIWQQANQADILHIAAHGKYNRNNSMHSAIYLTPDPMLYGETPADSKHDGTLRVSELYDLSLQQAELVVLSACEIQIGTLKYEEEQNDVIAGDEVVGITRALLFAGASSVIATLWKVDDKSTQLLMERFYTYLKDGIGQAEALRRAQIDLRTTEEGKYKNPYYWAAFVLSGYSGEIKDEIDRNISASRSADSGQKKPLFITVIREVFDIPGDYLLWLIGGIAVVIFGLLFLYKLPRNRAGSFIEKPRPGRHSATEPDKDTQDIRRRSRIRHRESFEREDTRSHPRRRQRVERNDQVEGETSVPRRRRRTSAESTSPSPTRRRRRS